MPIGLIGLERKRGKKTLKPFAKAARKVGKAAKASVKLQAGIAKLKKRKKRPSNAQLRRWMVRSRLYGSVITKAEMEEARKSMPRIKAAAAKGKPRRKKLKGKTKSAKF